MITEDELKQIELRCSETQPSPWTAFIEHRDHKSGSDFISTGAEDIYLSGATLADYDFIANARQDIPKLIKEIRELKENTGSNSLLII